MRALKVVLSRCMIFRKVGISDSDISTDVFIYLDILSNLWDVVNAVVARAKGDVYLGDASGGTIVHLWSSNGVHGTPSR